ncbi:Secretory immunoglobulin A-binding protein EsiB [Porphyridium purpureum]|uniref:Secretory immunoglobulin A-binding protein EsiB n=1 Tax=Porphyridium purpureum TaxID=35688 RepID=A0A5J4YH59_PORPP|nr:Secretory immunoglobulin A-binding protein EsiB [Porphyridium purpureum]|eukprot:POR0151..scf271_22
MWDRLNRSEYAKQWPAWVVNIARACLRTTPEERPTVSDIWWEFYDRMGAESATAAPKSQTAQYTAFPSGPSTAAVDALAGNISQVTVLSGESANAIIQPAADERADVEQEARDLPAQPEVELSKARRREEEAAAAEEARCDAADWQKRGRTAEDNEDFAEALVWYRKAVEKGDACAQCRLGCFCIKGLGGLRQDSSAAVAWFRKAVEQGHADAQYKMGYFYEEGRDELPLGACYEDGKGGLPQDSCAAVKWYSKAAEQGNTDAQNRLKELGYQCLLKAK